MLRRQLHAPPPPSGYVAIRNDATILSIAERNLIRSTSTRNNNNSTVRSMDHENLYLRVDGRKRTERRPIAIQLLRHDDPPTDASRSHNATTTTATVTFGAGTRVTCTVTSELVAPVLDRPNDGILSLTIDISPGASTNYRNATPASTYHLGSSSSTTTSTLPHAERHQKITSNHILRTLERCLVQPGGAVDTEALCVVPGAYVWKIHVACTILDDAGNVLDASVLAAMAALRHYRQPVVELVHATTTTPSTEPHAATTTTVATPVIVPSHIKEPTPLPLLHTPFAISFIFIMNHNNSNNNSNSNGSTATASSTTAGRKMGILLDPTNREEACQEGRLTIGMNVHREICFFDLTTGYHCQVQGSDLQYCSAVAESRVVTEWSDRMESALSEADERDRTRRLVQWQQQQQQQQLPLPPITMVGPPPDFDPDVGVDATTGITPNENENDEDIQYRRRALDFTMGHVASKIRENHPAVEGKHSSKTSRVVKSPNNNNNNTLLTSMLRSVQGGATTSGEGTTETTTTTQLPLLQNDDDDDDEEENVMELQSEFVTVPSAKKKIKR